MDHLWSPWRYQYVQKTKTGDGCVFCQVAASGDDQDNLLVYRGEQNFVMLNLYPYTTGHVMVVPYQHVDTLEDAARDTLQEMILLVKEAQRHLRSIYRPAGFNLGMNLGESAGAGIAEHIHMHVLPRWPGDTNFMTTVGETRVLPEALPDTWRKLRAAFAERK
ncbi:MAG TPA: HIT domain-containing protein [Bryobacteraceae bacterium]|nr:HIT domain-containing protein [Bryobacteraceae bacterium]